MHIGIDARLPFYQMGGISQYILHLLPALAKLDKSNQYTIFHSRRDGRSYLPSAENFSKRKLWTPSHHLFEKWSVSLELLPHRLDLLHSPDFIPPLKGAKRHVITIHDLNFLFYPQFLTKESQRYYVGQIDWAVKTAEAIAADSETTRQDIIEQLGVPGDKVKTIHLAANPLYEEPIPESEVAKTLVKYNLPPGFILFVGTLEPRKNLPLLIQAYKLLRLERWTNIPLILVGNKGWIFEKIFATVHELDLQAHIRHFSGILDEELAHFYRAAGVLVMPSHYEGFGLPVLEAMHCGCPVIASDRAALPEVVGDAGLLLDPNGPNAWADAIYRVLTDSGLRTKLVGNGRKQAQKFTWQKTAEQTLELYHG